MKFQTPAGHNPIDRMSVVGQPLDRIDGPLKTTGTAPYAYEQHDAAPDAAYGHVVGAGIAKGRIRRLDIKAAERAPGVLAVITADTAGPLEVGPHNTVPLLGGPEIRHYHQAVALVVAESFEAARAAAGRVRIEYEAHAGAYDLEAARTTATAPEANAQMGEPDTQVGDFLGAFADAPVRLDETYTTPDQSHMM
ncbi:MAG: xanthine dehydrogenase, partial [Azorhizobium sp. 32-67-21]